MKNIKTVIIILFFVTAQKKIFAQLPASGSYITNTTMGAFHGTWQWVNGTDTVRIYLITQKVYFDVLKPSFGFYTDNIVGWHLYKKGSQVIESSYNYVNTPYANGNSTILGGNDEVTNRLNCQLNDLSKGKGCEVFLTLNAAQNQLTWRSTEAQGMRVYTTQHPAPQPGLTLPRNMVLTKL